MAPKSERTSVKTCIDDAFKQRYTSKLIENYTDRGIIIRSDSDLLQSSTLYAPRVIHAIIILALEPGFIR